MTERNAARSPPMLPPRDEHHGHADGEQQRERRPAARRGRPYGSTRSEQQEAEHDHEARVEKVSALEGKRHGQEQQRRQQQRQAAAWRRAAARRMAKQASRNMPTAHAGGDVERQDVVGERKDQLPRLVGDGCEFGFIGDAVRAARQGRGQAERRAIGRSAASRARTDCRCARCGHSRSQFVSGDQHVEEQQSHQVAEEQRRSRRSRQAPRRGQGGARAMRSSRRRAAARCRWRQRS